MNEEQIEERFRILEATLLVLGASLAAHQKVLAAIFQPGTLPIDGKTLPDFLRSTAEAQIQSHLAQVADVDLGRAAWLAKYVEIIRKFSPPIS